jgi:pimeloyl-ACP methyl ester carboxylesterase
MEEGAGAPLVYLHDMWDVHTAQSDPFEFHLRLAKDFRVLMPAHPGCGNSTGVEQVMSIEDLAFHYLDLLDALNIRSATVVGAGLGGWIATEIAVRNPERIGKLGLIGAAGLQLRGAPIADVFMYSQHRDGGVMQELREILFADHRSDVANKIVPDGRVNIPDEVRRYQSLSLAGRVGWEPPYLHNKKLADRLHRITSRTRLVWGEDDHFVPLANGRLYCEIIRGASLSSIPGAGHSVWIEKPAETLAALRPLFKE